jgi:hypothetical protein
VLLLDRHGKLGNKQYCVLNIVKQIPHAFACGHAPHNKAPKAMHLPHLTMGHRALMAVIRDDPEALSELRRLLQNPNSNANIVTLNYMAVVKLMNNMGRETISDSQAEALKSLDKRVHYFHVVIGISAYDDHDDAVIVDDRNDRNDI